jgi:hypothetical protein
VNAALVRFQAVATWHDTGMQTEWIANAIEMTHAAFEIGASQASCRLGHAANG